MKLHNLLIVPVLASATLLAIGCKEEGPNSDKASVWTYTMTAQWADGKKRKIAARYEYGSRAARMSSDSGKVKTTAKTAGASKVLINASGTYKGKVICKIVINGGGRTRTVENSGTGSVTCTFAA